jgi:putative tricarboxylic transport membrane protein
LFGAIPGVGAAVANFVSYGIAKRRSKTPETFGKGNPEGVLASEACDSALAGGTMVPTLTLGIPGNATTAVMLAALYLHGIAPGPQVMVQNAPIAYAVLLALLVSSILILPIGILLAAPMTSILAVRREILIPLIIVVSVIGAFAVRNSMVDVMIAVAFGFLGLALKFGGFPMIPVILGLILGPMAEGSFVRSLMLGRYDVSIFWASPLSKTFIAAIVALMLFNAVQTYMGKKNRNSTMRSPAGTDAGV